MKTLSGFVMVMVLLAWTAPLPVAAQSQDTAKAIIVNLNYAGSGITYSDSRVIYGYAPDHAASGFLTAELLGEQGKRLGTFGIPDPRIVHYEDGSAVLETVDFAVILPFDRDAARLNLYRREKREPMVSVNLTDALTLFCRNNPKDPDCAANAPVDVVKSVMDFFNWILSGFSTRGGG